eukprot:m.909213 g.909213  ORF g.909213 m.909213 type:complete len:945 (-) comp23719_c0_seq14:143-2977(-)
MEVDDDVVLHAPDQNIFRGSIRNDRRRRNNHDIDDGDAFGHGEDGDSPIQLHTLAADRLGILGSTQTRKNVCQHLILLVLFLGVAVWNVALISQAVKHGNFTGFLRGRDSFGNTCGEGAYKQYSALYFFKSDADSLRICIRECPNITGNASTAAEFGVCLPASARDNVSASLAIANGILTDGPNVGCPSRYDASTSILNRCTPRTHAHALDGWHVDIVADAVAGWRQFGGALVVGVLVPLVLTLLPCSASVYTLCLVCFAAVTAMGLVTLFGTAILEGLPASLGANTQRSELEDTEVTVNYYVSCGTAAVSGAYLVVGLALLVAKKQRVLSSMNVLREAITVLRRNMAIVVVAYVTAVIYVGIVGVSVYAQLSVWGGCRYTAVLDNAAKTTAWSYGCKSIVQQSIPYALCAFCVWSLFVCSAFLRIVASRATALDFITQAKLHPRGPMRMFSRDHYRVVRAIRFVSSSPGDVIATSVLAILTAPLRWLRMTLGLAASPSYTHKRLCLRFLNCAFAPRVQVLASALAGQRRDLPAHFLQMCFWADEPHSDLAVLAADVFAWWSAGLVFAVVAVAVVFYTSNVGSADGDGAVRYAGALAVGAAFAAAGITSLLVSATAAVCDTLGVLCVRDTKMERVGTLPSLVPRKLADMLDANSNVSVVRVLRHDDPLDDPAAMQMHPMPRRNGDVAAIDAPGGVAHAAAPHPDGGVVHAWGNDPPNDNNAGNHGNPGFHHGQQIVYDNVQHRDAPRPPSPPPRPSLLRRAQALAHHAAVVHQNHFGGLDHHDPTAAADRPRGADEVEAGADNEMIVPVRGRGANGGGAAENPYEMPADAVLLAPQAQPFGDDTDADSSDADDTYDNIVPPAVAGAAAGGSADVDVGGARASNTHLCKVCLDAPNDCLLMPCRHQCLCIGCLDQIVGATPVHSQPLCPICRQPFARSDVIQVFL